MMTSTKFEKKYIKYRYKLLNGKSKGDIVEVCTKDFKGKVGGMIVTRLLRDGYISKDTTQTGHGTNRKQWRVVRT